MENLSNEEINKLLSYWISHNTQHKNDVKKWVDRIKPSTSQVLVNHLEKVNELYEEMEKVFNSAKNEVANSNNGENLEIKKQEKKEPILKKEKESEKFKLKKIGKIRTPYIDTAPYQPVEEDQRVFKIVVDPQYLGSLYKLDKFRYIYVLYYIHLVSRDINDIVSPPWTDGAKVGAFASRSPLRPNLIGLSVVQLKKIEENNVFISSIDCFDGTPLLDIKPYIKDLDSKCDANYGWIEDLDGYEHLLLHIKGIPHDY